MGKCSPAAAQNPDGRENIPRIGDSGKFPLSRIGDGKQRNIWRAEVERLARRAGPAYFAGSCFFLAAGLAAAGLGLNGV